MTAPQTPTNGLTFNFEAIATELRGDSAYGAEGQSARTLIRTDDLRVVLVVLKAGKTISEHHARVTASVQALSGSIRLRIGDKEHVLTPNSLLVMGSDLPHNVVADTDSAFLLTLGWTGAASSAKPA